MDDPARLFSLTSQRVLVTGAGGGIGTALAEALAGFGTRLAVSDLDGGAARALGADVGAEWSGALDITDEPTERLGRGLHRMGARIL
ncbi:MAG: hypothetical protein AAFR79_19875, partial [Pseudomonadota bacterium]